jgi:hypothetical protein
LQEFIERLFSGGAHMLSSFVGMLAYRVFLTKALRTRPRIRPRGVMEYWSVGVLQEVRIAPRVRGVGGAEGVVDKADRQGGSFFIDTRG